MSASNRSARMAQRRSGGSWKPGQSGNPNGRPPALVDISALARVHGPRCIAVAAALLDDDDPRIRLGAVTALLDRGYGKPAQRIEADEATSVVLLHLAAARAMSAQLIDGQVEPAPQQETNLLDAPTPTE